MHLFSDLSKLKPAEKKLLDACQNSISAIVNESRPSNKNDDNEIRADFIRYLIVDSKFVTSKGINLKGAWISGKLDLMFTNLNFSLIFHHTFFEKSIDLSSANTGSIYFINSILKNGLWAPNLICHGNLMFGSLENNSEYTYEPAFESYGIINLTDSIIHKNLMCEHAKFYNKNRYTLHLESIEINGNITFTNGFESYGTIRLYQASIKGNLECDNAKFSDGIDNTVLDCSFLEIGKSVMLRNGFNANGEVKLLYANIGIRLDCRDGIFNNNGITLDCSHVKVGNDVLLSKGIEPKTFEAYGEVKFFNAKIDGSFICTNGRFINENKMALDCTFIKITNDANLDEGFIAKGEVCLVNSSIGSNLDCSNGKFSNPKRNALSCRNANIKNSLIFDSKSEIDGHLDLNNTSMNVLNDNTFNYSSSPENIVTLDGCIYNFIQGFTEVADRIKWLNLIPKVKTVEEFQPQPWKQLARTLRNMGHNKEADSIMIEYNNQYRIKSKKSLSKLLRSIYGITSDYGYDPIKLVFTMLYVWFFCSVVYWHAASIAVFAPTNPLVFQDKNNSCKVNGDGTRFLSDFRKFAKFDKTNNWYFATPGEYSTFQPFWYSLDIILPVVDLQMEKEWGVYIPSPEGNLWDVIPFTSYNHTIRFLTWAETLIGWILSLTLVAILSGLAKNEKE